MIVYSGYVRLMQEGALGHEADAYLEKGDDEGPLLEAIRAVVARRLAGEPRLRATRAEAAHRCSVTKRCFTTARRTPLRHLPFIREGLARGEPILVAVDAEKIELCASAGRRGRTASSSPTWPSSAATRRGSSPPGMTSTARPGGPVRGIGEPIWAGRSAAELVECQLHEALLNVAFADAQDFRLLCPYDTGALPDSVIHEACCSHPIVDGARQPRLPRRGAVWRRSSRRCRRRPARRGCSASSSTPSRRCGA